MQHWVRLQAILWQNKEWKTILGGEKGASSEKRQWCGLVRAPYNKLPHGAVSTVPESAFV